MLTRLDDKSIDHAKVERAADILDGVDDGGKPGRRFGYTRAFGTFSWANVYANGHLTDGFVSQRAIEKYRIGKAECEAMVTVGLWSEAPGGYQIHDFNDWNPKASEVKASLSADRARKRLAYWRKKGLPPPGDDGGESDGKSPDIHATIPARTRRAHTTEGVRDRSDVEVTRDQGEPEREPAPAPPTSAELIAARFETFWTAYPNKVSKQDAAKVFARLKPDHGLLATILDAIARRKASGTWSEQRYIPGPDKWLRGRKWEDEVPGAKRTAVATESASPAWHAHCPHVPKCLFHQKCPEAWAVERARFLADEQTAGATA